MVTKPVENKGNTGLAAIAVAVWAVLLLAAFFSYRGVDVGMLPKLVGSLGGGSFFGSTGLLDSFAGVAIAVLIGISWYGLGSFAAAYIKVSSSENHSPLLELSMKSAIGAAIWSLIWFFLGIVGAYTGAVAAIVVVAGLVLAGLSIWRIRKTENNDDAKVETPGSDWVLKLLIAVPVVLAFVTALAPPTAKDTLLYHFSVPKAFIAQGSNAFIEGNIASYLALGTEMHVVWAMLLGGFVSQRAGETAAGATVFMFFPLLLGVIYGLARELKLDRRWSLLAVLIVATVPTAYHVASNAYIDLSLALYVTLAIYALGRWWKSLETGWLVYIAIFLGAALAVKLTTLFVIAAFALLIALRARQAKDGDPDNVGKIFAGGFAALVLACVIASPWYLRTWAETGSPIFPFYMSMWEGEAPGWDVQRSELFQGMNAQYGGAQKTPLDYLLAPWNLSVTAQPELAQFFDGVLAPAFLIGLPLLIWALWKFDLPTEVKVGAGIAGIMFVFWLFSSQQLRYLLPILPVLAIGIIAATDTVSAKLGGLRAVSQFSLTAAAVAGILVGAAWYLQKAPLRVVLGGESRDEYLTRNLDYYPYYRILNTETEPNAKIWLINMRRDTYNLERPYFSDYLFEDWTFRQMLWESRNVHELKAKAAAMGVKYVLTRHDFIFDYDRTSLIDFDKIRPRQENEAKLKIAREFVLDPLNTVQADKKFSLIKVF